MPFERRHRSLFETAVVIAVIGLLMAVAIERMLRLRVESERVAMAHVVASLQSALSLEATGQIVHRGVEALVDLRGENPMRFLSRPPENYLGELAGVDLTDVKKGSWYFDTSQQTLVYRARNPGHLETPVQDGERAAFQVELLYRDLNGDSRFTEGVDRVRGVQLVAVEP